MVEGCITGNAEGPSHDHQRVRPVLDRHRTVEFPHRGTDARRRRFVADLETLGALDDTADVRVDLLRFAGATGAGHGTMTAILLGLARPRSRDIETEEMERRIDAMRATGRIAAGRNTRDRTHRGRLHPATVDDAALPSERHDDHRTRRRRRRTAPRDLLLRRRRLRRHRGREPRDRVAPRRRGIRRASAPPRNCSSCATTRPADQRSHARASSRTRPRLRDPRPASAHLATSWWPASSAAVGRDGYLPGTLRVRRRAKDWFERLKDEDPDAAPSSPRTG